VKQKRTRRNRLSGSNARSRNGLKTENEARVAGRMEGKRLQSSAHSQNIFSADVGGKKSKGKKMQGNYKAFQSVRGRAI